MTPQNVCKRMKASVVKAETMKKSGESPFIPTVPGPAASAKTFTSENAPLITPNPRPATGRSFGKINDQITAG